MSKTTKKTAETVVQTLLGLNANIIVQEFISEVKGSDIRAFVVGNKVVAAMKRQAEPGDFRANIHRGGQAKLVKLTDAEREIAVKAAKIMGLRMAGVDLLRSKRGTLVLEINSSPGLDGIEKATGINIAGKINSWCAAAKGIFYINISKVVQYTLHHCEFVKVVIKKVCYNHVLNFPLIKEVPVCQLH